MSRAMLFFLLILLIIIGGAYWLANRDLAVEPIRVEKAVSNDALAE